MNNQPTLRQLSHYIAQELTAGKPRKKIASEVSAELIHSGRERETDRLMADVAYELELEGKLIFARVLTARPLSAVQKNRLIKKLSNLTGVKKISLEVSVNPSVLGGLRLTTATRSWDQTISTQLSDLRRLV